MSDDVLMEQARRIAAEMHGRWFADFEQVCRFADVLVGSEFLVCPADVVEFFRRPWKYSAEYEVWERCGQPSDVRGAAREILVALLDASSRGAPLVALT